MAGWLGLHEEDQGVRKLLPFLACKAEYTSKAEMYEKEQVQGAGDRFTLGMLRC